MTWINKKDSKKNSSSKGRYSLSLWINWLFLAMSVLMLAYTYYRAEVIFQGGKSTVYLKYYIVSLVGVFFWAGVLWLRDSVRANIVTTTISLIVGIYMVEAGLILSKSMNSHGNTVAKMGFEYDQRTALEVVDDLRGDGVDAVLSVRPNSVLTIDKKLLPLGGISNKTTVAGNENGYHMIYPSDRYGFNNPDSEWDAAQVEWLLIGDSFAEGKAVHPGKDIAGQIRVITNKSSISLGKGGNGPLIELGTLTEYTEVIKPKKVLWLYFEGNDLIRDLQRDKANPLLYQYMNDGFSQGLIHRQEEIDRKLKKFITGKVRLSKTRWLRLQKIRGIMGFDVVDHVDHVVVDPLFTQILTKAKARTEALGGEFYFVYLPQYERYSEKNVSHGSYRKKSEVLELVKSLNIPIIDIHQDVFVSHPDSLSLFPFRLNGHYNEVGYNEVAKAIVSNIKKQQ